MENWRKFVSEQEAQEPAVSPMQKLLGARYEEFVKWLGNNIQDPKTQAIIGAGLDDGDPNDDKFGFQAGAIPVAKLKPTQNEIDINKSLAFPLVKDPNQFIEYNASTGPFTLGEPPGEPIITFNGEYIIDGHHRWSTLYACNKSAEINVVNITLQGVNPLNALKAVQMAIGLQAKKIPVQKVEGSNLLKASRGEIAGWIRKNAPIELYEAIAAAPQIKNIISKYARSSKEEEQVNEVSGMEKAVLEGGLENYIWSNIASMRKTSQPVPGAGPRDFMPQTGGIDWQKPLAKGEVDVSPPLAKKAAEE